MIKLSIAIAINTWKPASIHAEINGFKLALSLSLMLCSVVLLDKYLHCWLVTIIYQRDSTSEPDLRDPMAIRSKIITCPYTTHQDSSLTSLTREDGLCSWLLQLDYNSHRFTFSFLVERSSTLAMSLRSTVTDAVSQTQPRPRATRRALGTRLSQTGK